jgi:hypothetical protein
VLGVPRCFQPGQQREPIEDVEGPAVGRGHELVFVSCAQTLAKDDPQSLRGSAHVRVASRVPRLRAVSALQTADVVHGLVPRLERDSSPAPACTCSFRPARLLTDDHDPERPTVDREVETPAHVAHDPLPEHIVGPPRIPTLFEGRTHEPRLAIRLAEGLAGAAMTNQFLLEESPWLPLALLVVAAVIAWARRSSNSILVDMLRR